MTILPTMKINKKSVAVNKRLIIKIILFAAILSVITGLCGCSTKYGSYKRNPEIHRAFQSSQVSRKYTYYYNGVGNQVYVIIGIEPKYRIISKFWREVEPDTEKFKELTSQIWEDYGYKTYGADILDRSGKKVGIVYTSIYDVVVKFVGDDVIEVMTGTPYLGGPGDGFRREPF